MNLRTSGEDEATGAAASGWIGDQFGLICRGAQLRSRSVGLLGVFLGLVEFAGWDLSLFHSYSSLLLRSLLFFFPDRERLQRCLVLEWLQGKAKCLTCIFYLLCCLFPDLHTSPCTFYLHFFLIHLWIFTPFIRVLALYLAISLHSFHFPHLPLRPHWLLPPLLSPTFLSFLLPSLLSSFSSCHLPIPTGRGCSPLTWPLRP